MAVCSSLKTKGKRFQGTLLYKNMEYLEYMYIFQHSAKGHFTVCAKLSEDLSFRQTD